LVGAGVSNPLIAIIVLLMAEKKSRPFIKFHAVQSLIFNVVLWIVIFLVSAVTLGFGAICAPLLWLATLWPAIDSYRGNLTEIPIITKFRAGLGVTRLPCVVRPRSGHDVPPSS
jgi:uncharacterized membrane protein